MLGNVLVLGNSGVGKSTLINAILGEEVAYTSYGTAGTTNEIKIYGTNSGDEGKVPFCLIDTMGFEPDPSKAKHAIKLVNDWMKEAKKEDNEKTIDLVWFCVDGCAAKLFLSSIECLAKAIKPWGDVPILVAITKSYSEPDQAKNIEMVYNAFAKQTFHPCNLRGVFPVVASTFALNESSFAPPSGLSALVDKTIELLPTGKKNAEAVINNFRLNRKKFLSQSIIAASVASAVTVCALPLPVVDALPLTAIERTEIAALARIYDIEKETSLGSLTKLVLECGAVTGAAKTVLSALKAIPGLNLAAAVLNSIVAGAIVIALGETLAYAYEQIYTGKQSFDIEWIEKLLNEKLQSNEMLSKLQRTIDKITTASSMKDIVSALVSSFFSKKNNEPEA